MSDLHPDVAHFHQTCSACPEQYSGTLKDGQAFYFRYRFGRASLAVGPDPEEVDGREHAVIRIGDSMQGCFETEDDRDQAFAELLAEVRL